MRRIITVLLLSIFLNSGTSANGRPAIPAIDRIRIAEAFTIGERLQNYLWQDWEKAPFSLLFITDDHEFLIRHPKPTEEFQSLGYDTMLKSEIFWRPRKFQKSFLATFPAFGQGPVIVAGKAENTTDKASTRWVFVLLHEHFHQLQYSKPSYYADVNALDLARGDATGMWQINFPFPYKRQDVADKFRRLSDQLLTAYNARKGSTSKATLEEYLKLRIEFARMLSRDDYRYASFQLWQEGIARYTQYRMATIASKRVRPSKAFRQLTDFTSFQAESDRLLSMTLDEMRTLDLAKWGRTVFYPFGAIEGLILDEVNPKWRSSYFTDKFALEKFYATQEK